MASLHVAALPPCHGARPSTAAARQQRRARPRVPASASAGREDGAAGTSEAQPQGNVQPAPSGPRRYAAVLGGEDFILSQRSGVEDTLCVRACTRLSCLDTPRAHAAPLRSFKGDVLGVDADIATANFRNTPLQSLSELDASAFHVPPRFLEAVALHCTKHYAGASFPGRAPPILAVWGPKGTGKSLLLKLCCKLLGVSPIILSASELEDSEAGEPGRRVASRYAHAAAVMATEGKATMLVCDDLDAGIGIWKDTLRTVNSQNVAATLMALCDDPGRGGVARRRGGGGAEQAHTPIVPIICTANDLSSIYAPLLRDGRTDKFYWQPTREETAAMAAATSRGALTDAEALQLVNAYPDQQIDFFASLSARAWDDAVRSWADAHGSVEAVGAAIGAAVHDAYLRGAAPGGACVFGRACSATHHTRG